MNVGQARAAFAARPAPVVDPASPVPAATPGAPPTAAAAVVKATAGGAAASVVVGKLVTGIAVVASMENCAKPTEAAPRGYEVLEPDDDDIETAEQAVAEGFRQKFPDGNVPWWLGTLFAMGNLYLGVRKTRKARPAPVGEIKPAEKKPEQDDGLPPIQPIKPTGN